MNERSDERAGDEVSEAESAGGSSPLRFVYLFGIGFNVLALAYALSGGATLYAGVFGLVIVYLVLRYRMIVAQ
ncbi:hypothetical protein [Natronobiforma cellulositropha]|uniref:hypothetical protein n=1 Tax=Natronobiforma cellulositropha TaxID=1679076 RepID=UPI0021D58B04|nr:hypothetical protein [Natronobiforma cellulositropha]